ncbi:MFS transporter [Tsukamurella soli]|uniref:MFS transporter n=1 Tax=Tsukamurella soli TaxID=644556 RepID=A0ABP8JL90_9ACTN
MQTSITAPQSPATRSLRESMPGLLTLAVAACLAVTTEMLPVGLLPTIARSFDVSTSRTGLVVTVYAVLVAVCSVPLAIVTRRLPRKPLILATTAVYLLSNTVIALAPSFSVVLAGRVVGGLSHALFFAVCIGYVPRIVNAQQVGRGLAIVGGGGSVGFVFGIPLSTAVGSALGWRAAFLTVAAALAVALVRLAATLPAVPGSTARMNGVNRRARGDLGIVVVSDALAFLGHYTVYTYITVVLLAAGVHQTWTGPLLMVFGFCGLIGLWGAGRAIDRRPRGTVLAVLAVLGGGLVCVGVAQYWMIATIAAVALWTGSFGGVSSMYQAAAVRALPDAPEIAGAWINSASNVGIGLGAALGGVLLETSSPITSLALVGAVLAVAGLGVAAAGKRAFPCAGYRGSHGDVVEVVALVEVGE